MHEKLANFDNICRFVRLFPFHRADYYVRKSFTLRWFDFAEFSVLQAKSSKSLLLSAFAFILTSFSFALYFSFFITLILSEFNLPILSFGLLLTSMVLYNSYLVNQSLCCYLLFGINIFSSVLLCISFTWVKFLLTAFFSSDSCWNLFLISLSWNPLYILFDISVCWHRASSCFDWCFCVCAELQLCFLLSRHLFYAQPWRHL